MSLKAKIEAIIYAAEAPVTLDQMLALVKESSGISDAQQLRSAIIAAIEELRAEYAVDAHGIELRQIAGGYRMSTKPEQHDLVRAFAKSLKPPIRLSLAALETLAVIAYKQPITVPEISEIRGVDSSGVIATLLDRKLISTSGRKDVIGRPILYKTTKEFLLRFGLKDVNELPSMEEFEKLVSESFASDSPRQSRNNRIDRPRRSTMIKSQARSRLQRLPNRAALGGDMHCDHDSNDHGLSTSRAACARPITLPRNRRR
jgi:segregation and condensation protein B